MANSKTDIVSWSQSKYGFYVERHWTSSGWLLEPGPVQLAPYHQRILDHIMSPGPDGQSRYTTVSWCEPKKSGKTMLAALLAKYMALHAERNSQVIMAGNKRDQAEALMFQSLSDSVQFSPVLPNVKLANRVITFNNGNIVKCIASNSRGEAGARFSLALFDEPWGYIHEDQLRLLSEFKPDPTRLHSMRFLIGYAGYLGESDLWEQLLNNGYKGQPVPDLADITNPDGQPACWSNGRSFVFWSHQCRQPWQTEQWQAEVASSERPADYQRMILTEFAEGIGNFCEPEAWQACIDPDHKGLPPGADQSVYVGLDIATAGGGDDCALVAVYPDDKQVKIAWHKVWKGRDRTSELDLKKTVYPYLVHKSSQYKIAGVYFDPYQAKSLVSDFEQARIRCMQVNQTHATRGPKDTNLLDLVNSRQLVLYDHADFHNLATAASVKELNNGHIFLRKAGGRSKIDLLVALSNCADEAAYRPNRDIHMQSYNPFYDIDPDWSN